MEKIILDPTMKNDFISYAMERKARTEKTYKQLPYITVDSLSKFFDYLCNAKQKTFCTSEGYYFYKGEQRTFDTTKIFFDNGTVLDNASDIKKYIENEFKTNKQNFIEENLYHEMWCHIERLLRVFYTDTQFIDDNDKREYKAIFAA